MKFTMWLFAGLFMILNGVFMLRLLWNLKGGSAEGKYAGDEPAGFAFVALCLTLGTVSIIKAVAAYRAGKSLHNKN